MTMMIKKTSPYLTFLGAIPFVICAICITMDIDAIRVLGKTTDVLSVYGLVIASFMAGAHWGNHLGLTEDNPWALMLPILSNIVALTLWLGFLILPVVGFIWLLVIGFISLLMIDYGLYHAQIITYQYVIVRKYVTMIVVVSLIIAALQL